MNVICERPFPLGGGESRLSYLNQSSNGTWGIGGQNLYHIVADETVERMPLYRTYEKMAYCPKTQTYWGISRRAPSSIFVLDSALREIDCLRVRLSDTAPPVPEDIWYDEQTRLLFLVTKERIYRLNLNGDLLGMFLGVPAGTEYRAVCTFENFVFVAAVKANCLSLLSYTIEGAYLEQVSLGGGYSACNLQVSVQPEGVRICVFTTRDYKFPVLLEVSLEHGENIKNEPAEKKLGMFSVECVSETSDIRSTCAVWET